MEPDTNIFTELWVRAKELANFGPVRYKEQFVELPLRLAKAHPGYLANIFYTPISTYDYGYP